VCTCYTVHKCMQHHADPLALLLKNSTFSLRLYLIKHILQQAGYVFGIILQQNYVLRPIFIYTLSDIFTLRAVLWYLLFGCTDAAASSKIIIFGSKCLPYITKRFIETLTVSNRYFKYCQWALHACMSVNRWQSTNMSRYIGNGQWLRA
jgi:hypothetical protein